MKPLAGIPVFVDTAREQARAKASPTARARYVVTSKQLQNVAAELGAEICTRVQDAQIVVVSNCTPRTASAVHMPGKFSDRVVVSPDWLQATLASNELADASAYQTQATPAAGVRSGSRLSRLDASATSARDAEPASATPSPRRRPDVAGSSSIGSARRDVPRPLSAPAACPAEHQTPAAAAAASTPVRQLSAAVRAVPASAAEWLGRKRARADSSSASSCASDDSDRAAQSPQRSAVPPVPSPPKCQQPTHIIAMTACDEATMQQVQLLCLSADVDIQWDTSDDLASSPELLISGRSADSDLRTLKSLHARLQGVPICDVHQFSEKLEQWGTLRGSALTAAIPCRPLQGRRVLLQHYSKLGTARGAKARAIPLAHMRAMLQCAGAELDDSAEPASTDEPVLLVVPYPGDCAAAAKRLSSAPVPGTVHIVTSEQIAHAIAAGNLANLRATARRQWRAEPAS